ncbi:MAG: SDR family NAD(P)-dependent oxidoreductase [Verrucomicrobiae bacterium]|nr:SDR family NAD(P)-dependent oxidoreductase [Verrucomicrobiae bacterium]
MAEKILVTGGAGFIGSFLVDALVQRGHDVTVFDNFEPQVHGRKRPDYLNKAAHYVKGDVTDLATLKKVVLKAEVIFHEAAMVGVGQSQYQIRRYTDVNVLGTANLLDILANNKHRCRKLIVAASMSSYGEGLCECREHGIVRPPLRSERDVAGGVWELRCPQCGGIAKPAPTPETASLVCNSIYAQTKKDQEEMVLMFGRTYGLPAVALRYFNVYGPRQSLSNPYTGVCEIFMSRIKNGRRPVVYEDGGQTRDFVSVHDIVQANLLAMEKPSADGQVFNVGTGKPISVAEVARVLARVYGADIEPEITGRFRKGDVRHCFPDIGKARALLGYEPRVGFDAGMRELAEWSRQTQAKDRFKQAALELKKRGLA